MLNVRFVSRIIFCLAANVGSCIPTDNFDLLIVQKTVSNCDESR